MAPKRPYKIDLTRLKTALGDAGGNYAAAARLHGNITKERVRQAVSIYPELREFKKKGGQGLRMRISDPALIKRAERYPGLAREMAFNEVFSALFKTKNIKKAAELLGISENTLRSKIQSLGGMKAILGQYVTPGHKMKIVNPALRSIAERHPDFWKQIAIHETVRNILQSKSRDKTARNLGISPHHVSMRLRPIGGIRGVIGKARGPKPKGNKDTVPL